MSIVDILSAAQNGGYFANAGRSAGLSAADAEAAVSVLAPAIATKLKDKVAADPDAFDQLLDLLDGGGDSYDLDDVDAMTSAEAVKDGAAILADLYGNGTAASLAKFLPQVSGDALTKISATSVLATLAATNANTLTDGAAAADTQAGGGGLLSVIFAAVMKGLMQGVSRQLAPRRRTGYYYGTRRRTARRRTRRPGLDDIFKSILNTRR
jgi:hypothetical protein